MGIHWNKYGWDCPDCGEWYTIPGVPLREYSQELYATITKAAADHSRECFKAMLDQDSTRNEALDELKRLLREGTTGDAREYGEYNGRVQDNLPDDFNPFDNFGQPLPPAPEKPAGASKPQPTLGPETIAEDIACILAEGLPHAQRQAKVAPHENYRLRPEDRTGGHPTRPR